MSRSTARCGTPAGFSRHQVRGETPCPACKAAKAAADKRWRETDGRRQVDRLRSRAQSLAHGHLRREYPAEYREVYERERTRLFAEHGLDEYGQPIDPSAGEEASERAARE